MAAMSVLTGKNCCGMKRDALFHCGGGGGCQGKNDDSSGS